MAWMHLASPEYSYLILKGCSHTLTEQGPDILFVIENAHLNANNEHVPTMVLKLTFE